MKARRTPLTVVAARRGIWEDQTGRGVWPDKEVIASPLIVNGKIYAGHRGAAATVIDLASGTVERDIAAPELGTSLSWASPIAANGRLYASPGDGKLLVFDTATWEVIANNQVEPFSASPVAVGDRL